MPPDVRRISTRLTESESPKAFDPRWLWELNGTDLKAQGKSGRRILARNGQSDHGFGALIEDVLAEDENRPPARLLTATDRIKVRPDDVAPSVCGPLDLAHVPFLGRRSLFLGLELRASAGQTNAAESLKLFGDSVLDELAPAGEDALIHELIDSLRESGSREMATLALLMAGMVSPMVIPRNPRGLPAAPTPFG